MVPHHHLSSPSLPSPAWDPSTLPEGDCGSVPVIPQSDGVGFASNIVVEFSHASFTVPPAVIATARVSTGSALGFGITLSQVGPLACLAVIRLAWLLMRCGGGCGPIIR